jgi:hypothetical protein
MAVKRMNYYTHQLLHEQDFKDEQAYHVGMRRRHNRLFHSWGVVDGLEVRQQGEHQVIVEPGMAVDHEGREILLEEAVTRDLSEFQHNKEIVLSIAYGEQAEEADHRSAGGVEGYVRITEMAEIQEFPEDKLSETAIRLARVELGEHGLIERIDTGSLWRKLGRAVNPSAGWLRLPFKPVRLSPVKIGNRLEASDSSENDFIVDEANAYCGDRGARGSMQIPVPPGANHIFGFRIAGTTEGSVLVRLFRTGWTGDRGEKTRLLNETLRDKSFSKEFPLDWALDELHALAISIKAERETEIWLVAVRFG